MLTKHVKSGITDVFIFHDYSCVYFSKINIFIYQIYALQIWKKYKWVHSNLECSMPCPSEKGTVPLI